MMKKILMPIAALFGAVQAWGATVEVSTWANLKSNLEAGNSVKLTANISQGTAAMASINGKTVTLDLNGFTITGSSNTAWDRRIAKLENGASLTLTDSSAGKTGTIDGGNYERTMVGGCVGVGVGCSFTMTGGTITKYKTIGPNPGGAICNSGTLKIDGGTIANCTSVTNGGAIMNANGATFTMNGGTIKNCACSMNGGAVYSEGTFTMNGGTISGCTASSSKDGGALYTSSGCAVTLKNGTISGCTAARGGGVYIISPSGTVTIENMTFTGNKALAGYGGAINGDNDGGSYVLKNCTITGNSATHSGGAICVGKNITVDIYDCTITGNTSDQGGAIYLNSNTGNQIRIYGIVLADNTKGASISDFKIDRSGAVTAYGGVYGANPAGVTNLAIPSGYASTKVGDNYVVGKSIAFDANNKLTAGTYTFCPTNAEYAAAGVEVKEGKFINAVTTVMPKTWTILDYETKADPTSTYMPTKIINGGFEKFPWMDYEVDGVRVTQPPSPFRNIVDAVLYPNGVDGGWNTTETEVSKTTGSCFENYYDADSSTGYSNTRSDGIRTLGYWTTKGGCGNSKLYNKGQNIFVEMNLVHADTLYQDLTTYGGDVIRWSLKHGFRTGKDSVQPITAYIGAPLTSSSSIVHPTRDNVNINSETLGTYTSSGCSGIYAYGNASELAALSLTSSQDDKWYTAQGVYVIPEGQSVTRFAFKSNAQTANAGNFLDDITFSTLIGNLRALLNDDGSVTITGYWGDGDTSKKLMVKIGDSTADAIDMSGVLNKNFKITVTAEKIGSANQLEVYHQDYESAKRTVVIGWAVTLNLNATDATCAKLTEYQRGAVTDLPIPARKGYAFEGWFDNGGLTGDAVTSIPADATGAKVFWAKWSEPLTPAGDDAWAKVKDGVCTITGEGGISSSENPGESPLWGSRGNIQRIVVNCTYIGKNAFAYFKGARDVVVGNSVTNIGEDAFFFCQGITNIYIGANVQSIGATAFDCCNSLRHVQLAKKDIPGFAESFRYSTRITMNGETPVIDMVPTVDVDGYNRILKGKKTLADTDWDTITNEADISADYHFFKFDYVAQ